MSLVKFYQTSRKTLSFEFFPPKKEQRLEDTFSLIRELASLEPDLMTVTYGAGGVSGGLTNEIINFICSELKIPTVAHLTCISHSREEIDEIVNNLIRAGASHILALRGDPPKYPNKLVRPVDGFSCARDLVKHLNKQTDLSIAVAGYPDIHRDARSRADDIAYLKEKIDAGAEVIFTQLFFEAESYFTFVEDARAAGIVAPIVPGIMPVSNVNQLEKFISMCGAKIPAVMKQELDAIREDEQAVLGYGIQSTVTLCRYLLQGGAPGIHLYTLNKSRQARPIVELLKQEGWF